MANKGKIDTSNVKEHQGFKWIKEYLEKASKDTLNLKEEEFIAVNELLDRLEKNYFKFKGFYDFFDTTKLTPKQKEDYIKYLEEK